MSLFGTINNSAGALHAAQIGLQTVGANIANANTPGYIRQELVQTTPEPSRMGNLILGHGVRAAAVVQKVDQTVLQRLWGATSDLSAAKLRERTLSDVESLLNDLNGGGLSDDIVSFNNAIHDLSLEPNDPSLRRHVIETASSLASEVQRTYSSARQYQVELQASLGNTVDRVNSLASKLADLNLRIMTLEGGRTLGSDATGLRDERYRTIEELAGLVNIRVEEQASGSVTVLIGGDYLVAENNTREIYVSNEREATRGRVLFSDTDAPVQISGGELKSMTEGRDSLLGGVLDGLDRLAKNVIREFNTIHSQGQGKFGFDSLVGSVLLSDTAPIDQAGLTWNVEGGAFEISLVDESGKHISRHRIDVRTGSTSTASTVASIMADIDAIDGISASVLPSGEVMIRGDVPGVRFTFGEDTSGFVAAAGLNTMFVGHNAETVAVNPVLLAQPDMLAISRDGIGNDTDTLSQLVDLVSKPILRDGGTSIREGYTDVINHLAQTAANQKASTAGLEQYYTTLQSEHMAISGVNIDEEAIKMIGYQRAFQASSRVIAAANEMLEILTNL